MSVQAKYTAEEIGERGEALYEKQIRAQVEEGNIGRYIPIDIETGEYEIGDEHLETVNRLLARRPDALVCTLKIGYPVAAVIGGRLKPHAGKD